jgi:hypothetical protein
MLMRRPQGLYQLYFSALWGQQGHVDEEAARAILTVLPCLGAEGPRISPVARERGNEGQVDREAL